VTELQPDGRNVSAPAPAGAELLAGASGRGALVRVPDGAADRLVWVDRVGAHVLATLNPAYADLETPDVRPVRHRGPDGRPLTSWLVLPAGPHQASPPPLVIWPYIGRAYAEPPVLLHPRYAGAEDPPRLLAAHGYAVLLPSLPRAANDSVPSDGVAATLLAIVDAAAAQPDLAGAFDPQRLALWGHSFGGYATIAAITQSGRFRAAVAAASRPNLLAKWGDLTPPRRLWPEQGLADPGWTEDLQGDTRGPPWKTPERFLLGSPLMRMDRAQTPLLLAHGELDNFSLLGAEQAFSAYLRQNRDAVLATYWGEGHVLRSPGNLRDYYRRALAFLDGELGFTPPGHGAPTQGPERGPANGAPTPPQPPRAAAEVHPPAR
jgi:dipeptidyl aminopeptidase/acylaminoacyl peptidase